MSLNWPPALSMLRGLQAIATQTSIELPPAAKAYVEVEGQLSWASDIPVHLPSRVQALKNRTADDGQGYLMGIDEFLQKLDIGQATAN